MTHILTIIVDPGHAWLKVPMAAIAGMRFSKYSMTDGEYAYLEEDCDLARYLDQAGIDRRTDNIEWREIYINQFNRMLPSLPTQYLMKG